MLIRASKCWFCILILLILAGCGGKPGPGPGGGMPVTTADFLGLGEDLAIQLKENLRRPAGRYPRLIMATFVNIDDLGETSRFGRTLAEALANRLFRHGFGVEEIRKSHEIMMKNHEGELVLSRDASRVAATVAADGIVSGTYSLTPDTVIVTVRLLDAASLEVLSVADLEIQRGPAVDGLLWGNFPENRAASLSALER